MNLAVLSRFMFIVMSGLFIASIYLPIIPRYTILSLSHLRNHECNFTSLRPILTRKLNLEYRLAGVHLLLRSSFDHFPHHRLDILHWNVGPI